MAIDDNTNYTLTGAQVKDLATRIKAAGGGMTVYVDASFANPSSITGVFSDSALTTPADPDAMADTISAGDTVVVIYDGGQSQELIELSSVNSNSRFPEVGQAFTSVISTNAVFSAPTVVTLLYDDYSGSWSAETTAVTAVNDATLTIQHNGTNVQAFTANQSTNATANIETIWADDIAPATAVPPITNDMIDWSTVVHQVPISDFITMNSGYSILNADGESHVFVCGKVVIAHLVVQASSNFTGSQVTVGIIKPSYAPIRNLNGYGGLGNNQWNLSGICYSYIAINGQILIADHQNTGKSYAKIMASWVIN